LIEIDGGYGEGGGQIIRMAVAFSAITGKDVRISNIRANRPKPGLANQHLTSIRSVAELSGARVKGLHKGSREIRFSPGNLGGGDFSFDIGTAGSVTLVLQACLLPALLSEHRSSISITGGTDVRWSPPWDYFEHVFLEVLKRVGGDVRIDHVKRGYYPRGGGKIRVIVNPCEGIRGQEWTDQPNVERIGGYVHVGNLPDHILHRMEGALDGLKGIAETAIRTERLGNERATGQGGAVVLRAEAGTVTLGADALAERGVKAEKVAQNAADSLVKEIEAGATADVHLSDQILPYLAIADGRSTMVVRELTNHAKTHMWLLEKLVDVSFQTERLDGGWRIGIQPSRTLKV
jgi:RNA 3'-phosphate cyclase